MEQINSIAQCLESKVNEQQNQEQNREYLSDALPKKRIRVTKREKKELKKQQNIKEGKINQKQQQKPQEIQHEPVLREMIALPNMKEETNGMTIMTYNVTYFSFISCVNCNFKATSIVNYISF